MRKKLSVSFILLAITAAAWLFTGCGDKGQDDDVTQEEEINRIEQPENTESGEDQKHDVAEDQKPDAAANQTTDDNAPIDESTGEPSDTPANNVSDTPADESSELSVYVDSIGDKSVVGNKIFIEAGVNENSEIMLVGIGGDNKTLITVHFEDDAAYIYEIIRNGGADVETREGSFSDIKLNMILHLTGYYKGEDFCAAEVVISDVRTN